MSQVFRTSRLVQFCETDAAGIAHFSSFIVYMEQAEHELLRSIGESVVSHDDQGVVSWPRVTCECSFVGPVHFEEEVDIEVSISRLGTSSVTYDFRFSSRDKPVAKGTITSVCCRVGQPGGPQSIPIPDRFVKKLTPFVQSSPTD